MTWTDASKTGVEEGGSGGGARAIGTPTENGIDDVVGRLQRRRKVIHKGDVEVFELFGESLPLTDTHARGSATCPTQEEHGGREEFLAHYAAASTRKAVRGRGHPIVTRTLIKKSPHLIRRTAGVTP